MRYIKGHQSPGILPPFFSQTGNRPPRNTARKQQVPRFMKKNGLVNIRQDSKEKFERFISDFFTTMGLDLTSNDLNWTRLGRSKGQINSVDMDMGFFFFLFIFFYAFSWIVFSFVYWINAKIRGSPDKMTLVDLVWPQSTLIIPILTMVV